MALSNEELKLQIDILTSRTDDNDGMKYSKLPGINKGLNPDFFTGNNTRIVNAINKLAQDVAAMQTAVIDMINKTNGVILDVNSVENQEVWKETKRLMREDTIIEGIRAILEGRSQDRIFDLSEDDEGKILTVVIDDDGKPVVRPVEFNVDVLPDEKPEKPEEPVITSAYEVVYLNGELPGVETVGSAIDHILDQMKNIDFEISWDDIQNKPSIGNKLELNEDSLSLVSEENAILSSVPLMNDEDVYDLVNTLK
jgi:hypothetical protein